MVTLIPFTDFNFSGGQYVWETICRLHKKDTLREPFHCQAMPTVQQARAVKVDPRSPHADSYRGKTLQVSFVPRPVFRV